MKKWTEPSSDIRNRAERAIAQGALTNSKRPTTFIEGIYPSHAKMGRGALLYADNKPYVDYVCALGSNLLGYGCPQIKDAIADRYGHGATLSLSSEIEVDLAEKLKGLFSFTELWKFAKTGSEATSGALKIARAYTGRDIVLSDGYHGNDDDFVTLMPPAHGVPKRAWMLSLEENWDLIPHAAAVIIEPVVTDYSDSRREYLKRIRHECSVHKTVLIFDEIITGFRFPKYSVSNYFGIQPDLICLGKALGGGLPLSAIGGNKEIMNCAEYFFSGTFFGETCSIAASLALINLIHADNSRFKVKELWDNGQVFLTQFNGLHPKIKIEGYPTRGAFRGDDTVKALLWQEACKAGILFGPSWFFNFPLQEYTHSVIHTCRDILTRITNGQVKLEGKPPQPTFAQKTRGDK